MTSQPDSDGVANLYRSTPLSAEQKCIRLLHIQAAEQGNGSPICGTMAVVSLSSQTSFTALSYVWGQKTAHDPDAASISCNGYLVTITPNCLSALRHLRQRLGSFSIWIDAVCINQADDEEKAFQIPLLGDIYTFASKVYIWLGEGDSGTDRAMSYLETAGLLEYTSLEDNVSCDRAWPTHTWTSAWFAFTSFCRASSHPFPFIKKDNSTMDYPFIRRKNIPTAPYASYYDLDALLTREWTRRIWTYQEIMLATEPIVVCGHSHIRWSRLAWSLLFLDHIKPTRLGNLGIPLSATLSTWKKIILTRARLLEEVASTTLMEEKVEHSRIEEDQQALTLQNIAKYRRFLFNVFRITMYLCRLTVCIAWMSLANCAAAIIITAYKRTKSPENHHILKKLYIYTSISSIAFVFIFTGYSLLAYSYYLKTLFNMPLGKVWRQRLREDSVDDFVDAIITRKASNPKDMAFGLRSVLSMKLGSRLPPPDYASSLGQTYRDLTKTLLRTTDHLQFLLPAAENCIDGEASWIPNYSASFSNYWLQPYVSKNSSTSFLGTGTQEPQILKESSLQENKLYRSDSAQSWALASPRLQTLTIYAHHYCTVTSILPLQATSPQYTPSESAIHLANMKTMRLLCSCRRRATEILFFSNLLNFPSLSHGTGLTADHLRTYVLYLHTARLASADRMFKHMTAGMGSVFPLPYGLGLPLWRYMTSEEVLNTHIKVVNEIVRTRRRFFVGRSELPGKEKWEIFGVATQAVRTGDRVVLVPGLPSLLALEECADGFRLRSPAVMIDDVEREVQSRVGAARGATSSILEPFDLV